MNAKDDTNAIVRNFTHEEFVELLWSSQETYNFYNYKTTTAVLLF